MKRRRMSFDRHSSSQGFLRQEKAIKKDEGEEEAGVEVTFDTHPVLVETPLTEGFKKIRELELELNALEKKEELIKMQKATVLQELRKEKKRALLLLKNSLENE